MLADSFVIREPDPTETQLVILQRQCAEWLLYNTCSVDRLLFLNDSEAFFKRIELFLP